MTTGKAFGQLWSHGARDWASFVEPHYRPLYEAVHDRLGIRSDVRLLDVGCGPGGSTQLAAGRGGRVAGLDASPDSIEVARERNPAGDFRVGDMESLPWPDGRLMLLLDLTPSHSLEIPLLRWRKLVAS